MNIRVKAGGVLAAALVAVICSCNKAATPPKPAGPDRLNRVQRGRAPAPQNFLNKTFRVGTYVKFGFDVPAHALSPKLQGSFKAFLPGGNADAASEDANVDFLLMNTQELEDFEHEHGGIVRYSISAAHDQGIDYALPPTLEDAVKYYVVFRNAGDPKQVRMVKADLTVSF